MKAKNHYKVALEANTNEPASVIGLFDILRREAALFGLTDVEDIYIEINVEFSGLASDGVIDKLRYRLDQLWLTGVDKFKVTPRNFELTKEEQVREANCRG